METHIICDVHKSSVRPMLMDNLPPANTIRWVKSKKAAIVQAIESGSVTERDVCEFYGICEEELASWVRLYHSHGAAGLRATHLKRYREIEHIRQNFQIVAD